MNLNTPDEARRILEKKADALDRMERAWCIEGDYVPDYDGDERHPVERRVSAERAMFGLETRRLQGRLSLLSSWADQFGAALCPNGRPDTFGEGMRAAKGQVKRLLAALEVVR